MFVFVFVCVLCLHIYFTYPTWSLLPIQSHLFSFVFVPPLTPQHVNISLMQPNWGQTGGQTAFSDDCDTC